MLLWDGNLLNFHFGDSNHSLQSWGVSFGSNAGVDAHDRPADPFASDGLNGHWTLDNLMPLLSAQHLIDTYSPGASVISDGLAGTVETVAATRHDPESSALILPTVLKVEEPFAMPLTTDISTDLTSDIATDVSFDLLPDLLMVKSQWTAAYRATLHSQ
jgi:hypothetical protein